MAKHSGELVADIDDGYVKVAFILFEALFCMPLTKAELRVAGFIMRRTYGWAKNGDRDSGKMDIITSKTIAKGTQLGLSNVKKSIVSLAKNNVIFAEKMPASNSMAYGINPVIKEWGSGDKEWEIAKKQLLDAKSDGHFVNSGEYKKTDSIEAQKDEEGITPMVTTDGEYNTYSNQR